jgi:N-acetylneuraminic acid mutarotase
VRRAATLPNAQHDAQAARLGSKVYVFGGGQFSQYDHILAFDPSNDTVASVGTLPRAESDVAVAGNGVTAYVVGGFDGARSLASIVAWAPGHQPRVVAELPLALRYAAAALTDGQLIVAGGSTPDGQASDGIYGFDVVSGRVRRLGRLPQPLTHSAAAVLGGSVYLVGGRGAGDGSQTAAVLRVDPATGAVRRAATLPLPLSDAGVVAIGGAIVVAGGRTPAGTQAAVGELVPSR